MYLWKYNRRKSKEGLTRPEVAILLKTEDKYIYSSNIEKLMKKGLVKSRITRTTRDVTLFTLNYENDIIKCLIFIFYYNYMENNLRIREFIGDPTFLFEGF